MFKKSQVLISGLFYCVFFLGAVVAQVYAQTDINDALLTIKNLNSVGLSQNACKEPSGLFYQEIFQELNDTAKKNWTFKCSDPELIKIDPLISNKFETYFKNIAVNGLLALSRFNPSFTRSLLKNMKNKRLTITCEPLTDLTPRYERLGFLSLSWNHVITITTEFITQLAAEGSVEMKEKLKAYCNTCINEGLVRNSPKTKNIIFHEFLHFAGADNLSEDEHNLGLNGGRSLSERDLIYACANTIYKGFVWLQPACLSCVLARQVDGKNIITSEPAAVKRANEFCSKLLHQVYPGIERINSSD